MPDSNGNFKGISVPSQAWERIFAPKPTPSHSLTREQRQAVMQMVQQMKP